jgi:hypothetical protein
MENTLLLKNVFGKYDPSWAIGDIRLARTCDFCTECVQYEGAEGFSKYHVEFAEGYSKIVFEILDEHIRNGTETLTNVALAAQFCVRIGLFSEAQRQAERQAMGASIRAKKPDECEMLLLHQILGSDPEKIEADIKDSAAQQADRALIRACISPENTSDDDKRIAWNAFFSKLRFTVTCLMREFIFKEV